MNGQSSSTTGPQAGAQSGAELQLPRHEADGPQTSLSHEEIPRLTRPSGEPARSLPAWDPEPPAFLIKRGERA